MDLLKKLKRSKKLIIKLMRFQFGTSKVNVKIIDKCNKITYNEYNSSGYLISTIIKNVSRNPICVE